MSGLEGSALIKAFDECSFTVRRAMFAVLGFSLFCLLTAVGTPDTALIAAEAQVQVPFADVKIGFVGFLIVGPLMLIVLAIYLHVFFLNWKQLEAAMREKEPEAGKFPTLFSLSGSVPRHLTGFIFYWLVPFALAAITWKAMARVEWGLPLVAITVIVTLALQRLRIRLSASGDVGFFQRPASAFCATAVVLCAAFSWVITEEASFWPMRPLNLFRADLKDRWLIGADLRGANMAFANLDRATVLSPKLQRANLMFANLRRARFYQANFQGALLKAANLHGANLYGANLEGADLNDANLERANLLGANMNGANLDDVNFLHANLAGADLRSARVSPGDLKRACTTGPQPKLPEEIRFKDVQLQPCPASLEEYGFGRPDWRDWEVE